jgi:hypothetical protein
MCVPTNLRTIIPEKSYQQVYNNFESLSLGLLANPSASQINRLSTLLGSLLQGDSTPLKTSLGEDFSFAAKKINVDSPQPIHLIGLINTTRKILAKMFSSRYWVCVDEWLTIVNRNNEIFFNGRLKELVPPSKTAIKRFREGFYLNSAGELSELIQAEALNINNPKLFPAMTYAFEYSDSNLIRVLLEAGLDLVAFNKFLNKGTSTEQISSTIKANHFAQFLFIGMSKPTIAYFSQLAGGRPDIELILFGSRQIGKISSKTLVNETQAKDARNRALVNVYMFYIEKLRRDAIVKVIPDLSGTPLEHIFDYMQEPPETYRSRDVPRDDRLLDHQVFLITLFYLLQGNHLNTPSAHSAKADVSNALKYIPRKVEKFINSTEFYSDLCWKVFDKKVQAAKIVKTPEEQNFVRHVPDPLICYGHT